jgi:hypothetical protein
MPGDLTGGVSVGLYTLGADLTIEKKGQLKGEDAGLAAAVVSADQEATSLIPKFLILIFEEVDEPATQGLKTMR